MTSTEHRHVKTEHPNVQSVKSAEQLEQQLQALITDGSWPVGMKLPSMRNLAQTYGVSTNIVQLVMGRLGATGLVSYRPRSRGVVVARKSHVLPARQSNATQVLFLSSMVSDFRTRRPVNNWRQRILGTLEHHLLEQGMDMVRWGYSAEDPDPGRALVARLQDEVQKIAGVVAFSDEMPLALVRKLETWQIPVVGINRPWPSAMNNIIVSDNFGAGLELGLHLARAKVRRILLLGPEPQTSLSLAEKLGGLMAGYLRTGKELPQLVYAIGPEVENEQAGYEMTQAFLSRNKPPEVIFAAGDYLAFGAIRACREVGLDVPKNVGVVGCTNLEFAEHYTPSLTVLAQPMEEMGHAAAQMLLDLIRTQKLKMPMQIIPSSLILRDSLKLPADVAG